MIDHAQARTVVVRWLARPALDRGALIQSLVPEALPGLASDLARSLDAAAAALPADPGSTPAHPVNQAPIPADVRALLAQLAPLVVAHPSDTGLNLGLLAALAECWPHVASEERPVLRTRFVNGLLHRASQVGGPDGFPREAIVTSAELAVWNRYLPTANGTGSAADLTRILGAGSGQEAYRLLSSTLMGGLTLSGIAHALATLALQVAERQHDPRSSIASLLIGAVATQHLAGVAPDETVAALLVQLNHHLWWTAAHAQLPPRDATGPILEGLPSPRTARTLGGDLEAWRGRLSPALAVVSRRGRPDHALTCAWLLNRRSADGRVAPDDAAAVVAAVRDSLG